MDPQHLVNAIEATQAAGKGATLNIDWSQFAAVISAIGALGIASFGVVEALGKALTIVYTQKANTLGGWLRDRGFRVRPGSWQDNFHWPRITLRFGLPYVGIEAVRKMARPLRPALECAYGLGYMEIIAQQYRSDRGSGRAPDMIRDGVKLGLPFLSHDAATLLIDKIWHMGTPRSAALAAALNADTAAQTPPQPGAAPAAAEAPDAAQLLAGRFATALVERVDAAFALAEERYQSAAKLLAGAVAITLALIFNLSLKPPFSWLDAAIIGIVAVPLAPVAKDLSTSLQSALSAFKSIPSRRA
jgi:hypothetical protein